MTSIPRLRLGGPVGERDATVLLTVAVAMVAAKLPLGFLALLGLPLIAVVVQGIRPRAPWPRTLRLLLAAAWLSSLVSVLVTHPAAIASTSANVVIMTAIGLVAAAVFAGGRPRRAADRIVDGLYLGLLLAWAISIGELVTGFKFLPRLYPHGNTASTIANQRLYVSAFFPNYNDYSVAMVMLCLCVVAKMVFQAGRSGPVRAGRWTVLASATFLVVYMGSRGALLALLTGVALIMLSSVRSLHPRAIGARLVTISSVLLLAGAGGLLTSSYVQDHSTAERGQIAGNIFQMMAADPLHALLGWGTLPSYQADASARYGPILMDPHNVLLEIIVWYGLIALAIYLLCWWQVLHLGVLRRHDHLTWRASASTTISVLMPMIGVVCSSTLRYHLFWLWLIVAMFQVQQWRREARETRPEHIGPGASSAPQEPSATSQSISRA